MRLLFAIMLGLLSVIPSSRAAELKVWAIGEGVRIDPLTGKAFEENAKMLPGTIGGDYQSRNWVWNGATKTVMLKGAANEVLGFQIILEGAGVKGINLAASALKGSGNAIPASQFEFFRAFYVNVDQKADAKRAPFPLAAGWYADPLVPLSTPKHGAPFAIDGSNFGGTPPEGIRNQTVFVDLWIPKNTGKGTYTGTITVSFDGGKVELPVSLDVFGFEIPDQCHTALEFMSYSAFAARSQAQRDACFRVAQPHRATITNTKPLIGYDPPLKASGDKLIWEGFDKAWGPAIDGSLYKTGPRAGVPLDYFNLPFDPILDRPELDGRKATDKGVGWPIKTPVKPGKLEVDFTPEYVAQFKALLKDASEHFAAKYPKTTIVVFQDSLDEPGFHKATKEAAFAQLRSIQGYIKIFNELKLKNVMYKLDIGGGFDRCKYDLDGNGKMEGSRDVVSALARTDLWNIHGMCVDLTALQPEMKRGAAVWFYNGFEPRVGPTAIATEGLGPRTWPWVVWNSKMQGMCQWEFLQGAKGGEDPWKTGGASAKNPFAGDALFIYTGEGLGLPGEAFPTLRLKAYRRGMQDYEYLYLLERKAGSFEAAMKHASLAVWGNMNGRLDMKGFEDDHANERATVQVVGDQRMWSHNPEVFEQVRYGIGAYLGGAANAVKIALPPSIPRQP